MKQELKYLINILGKLKETNRSGWEKKKIKNPETVAAHSYGVCLLTLLFAPAHLDKEKCLKMAIIHDIQEALVGDITPYDDITAEEKSQIEAQAVYQIEKQIKIPGLKDLFMEYEAKETPEARFVKDMDKLDAVLQAKYYDENQKTKDKIFNEFYNYAFLHTNREEEIVAKLFETVAKI